MALYRAMVALSLCISCCTGLEFHTSSFILSTMCTLPAYKIEDTYRSFRFQKSAPAMSHSRKVLSCDPLTKVWPSGEKATDRTASLLLGNCCTMICFHYGELRYTQVPCPMAKSQSADNHEWLCVCCSGNKQPAANAF